MKSVHVIAACFIFALLQMLLASRVAVGEISPDFLLLLVAYFAIHRRPTQGAVTGFLIGLFQDLFNPGLLGLNALTKSVTGYGLAVAGSKYERESAVFLLMLFAVAAAAHDFLYLLFFTRLELGRFIILWFTVALPSALYTAVWGVLIHKVTRFVEGKVVRTFGKARF